MDFSEQSQLDDAIRRYHSLLRLTFESNLIKLFETQYGTIARFVTDSPKAPGKDQDALRRQVAEKGTIDVDLRCPVCSKNIPLQVNFAKKMPDTPGRTPYPEGDAMTCPNCQRQVNLAGTRREIERNVGKEVIPS